MYNDCWMLNPNIMISQVYSLGLERISDLGDGVRKEFDGCWSTDTDQNCSDVIQPCAKGLVDVQRCQASHDRQNDANRDQQRVAEPTKCPCYDGSRFG